MASNSPWYSDPKYQQYWQSYQSSSQAQPSTIQQPANSQNQAQAVSYWRALAVGLQYENEQLHQLLYQLTGTNLMESVNLNPNQAEQYVVPDNQDVKEEKVDESEILANSASSRKGKNRTRAKKKSKFQSQVQEEPSDDGELEAYLRFASETERHRQQRDSNLGDGDIGDERDSDEEHKVNESKITVDYERLKEEMSELYGKDALKIHCQETRTELAFTEWRDKHRPVTWPAMPLNM